MKINTLRRCASAVYYVRLLIPITFATIIWSACSKSEPPDGGFGSPVFSVGIEAPPDSGVGLTAGLDGTYLFTRVERGSDGTSPLVMSGAFADASCPAGDCPGSVKFEFTNEWLENFVRPDSIFAIDQSWEYKSPLSDSFALHTVSIQWVKTDGSVLRSDLLVQPQDTFGSLSYFTILASEPWEVNERGEKTWKMNVDFSCWLLDPIQGQERKVIGSGVIAVGYR
ncbi:MAG: hypothetical protein ACKVU0_16605 [Saprospiraceae bacterium]